MDQNLQTAIELIEKNAHLSEDEKAALIAAMKETDKKISITEFKLDRTEKVKRTTAILLEETIAELEQKRKAVEAQNRDLLIESSLERVRSVAMGMKNPGDMIDICRIISGELQALKIENIRNVQTAIINDEKGTYLNYEYFTQYDTTSIQEIIVALHPKVQEFADEVKKSADAFFTASFEGKELDDWREYRNQTNQNVDPMLDKADSVYYYFYSIGPGALGVSTYTPLSEEDNNVFKRFRNVFDLAYRRFIDIEKAEAQAREAQIQLALERVRARTMAMQKSDELSETSYLLFEQFRELGQTADQISIGIIKEEEGIVEMSATIHGNQVVHTLPVPLDDPIVMKKILKGWKAGEKSMVIDLSGKELNEYNTWRNKLGTFTFDTQHGPEDHWVIHAAFHSKGILSFSSSQPAKPETLQLLERFAAVFDLTYTRFLDLKQAESQVRESQIQLALERVRARTMAMHHSNELAETAAVLFRQIKDLGFDMWSCGFCIWTNDDLVEAWMSADKGGLLPPLLIPYKEEPTHREVYEASLRGEPAHEKIWEGEPLTRHYEFLRTIPSVKEAIAVLENSGLTLPSRQCYYVGFFKKGYLLLITKDPTAGALDLSRRFAQVFDLTYTRFLDLQKAEAQAREAQIELGLERVRARAMAMQKSDELAELVDTVFKELTKLDFALTWCIINIIDEPSMSNTVWAASPDIDKAPDSYHMKFEDYPFHHAMMKGWKERKTKYVYILEGHEKKDYDEYLFNETEFRRVPAAAQAASRAMEKYVVTFSFSNFGGLQTVGDAPLSDANLDILSRFGKVFDLTYTRFNDLKQAEAQTREAKIEAALEKVRSRTMAMQRSDELGDVATVLFKELNQLVENLWTCGFVLCEKDRSEDEWWLSTGEGFIPEFYLPNIGDVTHQNIYNGWKKGETYHTEQLEGQALQEHYDWLMHIPVSRKIFEEMLAAGLSLPTWQKLHCAYFSYGYLVMITQVPCPEEQVFKRFAQVFDQTYTRFLDLQKAEGQAREATIEAGLERVRARTMAMHSSDDVSTATATMFVELEKLGIENYRGGIAIFRDDMTQEVWSVNNLAEEKSMKAVGIFDMNAHPFWKAMNDEWKKKEEFMHYYLNGKEKENYVRLLNATPNYFSQPIKEFPDIHFQVYYFGEGAVWANSLQPHSEEDKQVMKRFSSVFSLTFRRYQDLKKAEAQAREATIEAALEKVRGKAMAMHNSADLSATASMVFTELRKLGIAPLRSGVGLLNKENRKAIIYAAVNSEQQDNLVLTGSMEMSGHPVFSEQYEKWLNKEDYYPVLEGAALTKYYERLSANFTIPEGALPPIQYGYFLTFTEGFFFCWSEKSYDESEQKILQRFKAIIDLTFRRYIELQKSEINAREAVKQAALDRVRADIASMRTIADLDRITPLIWNELTILGLPFIRCGVFIMDDDQQIMHTFLSTPEGKAIAAFHLPYSTPGNISQVLSHWKEGKSYTDHWDDAVVSEFADNLVKQGAIVSKEQYLSTIPHGGFYLHFLPFLQGMLYVGCLEPLGEEEKKLIQSVADAFSTAYARYEDFNKLEAAKQQVDKTLVDLKLTQQQLVQSEKMASLGELTAGIAHEIQNPLNFVNNFSEVNTELIEEMKDEIDKGNLEDAKAIANDIKDNEEKINHHGKRADAIVKGMLQHSRSSSGVKEPTDINALADEYLRLAYHGLRAKDKSFNATMKTDYDQTIGKINVIPQDIGRVILNLITNAFYAASLPSKGGFSDSDRRYDPTIWVNTKKVNDKVLISVRDNGPGIPQNILDKIFQPFFTTKPTGQGTGLGLSMSYDIVRAHGGELKVETKEGEGSEFIIQLPFS